MRSPVTDVELLSSQVRALEQLLFVYEQAVLEQSAKLERAREDLARRVEQLATSNNQLSRLNARLVNEMNERRTAQENLRRSQRLASIGTLAAGLAHEINNPLGLITLEVHHASLHRNDPQVLESSLDAIAYSVTRCSRIVKSVLQFARNEETEKWPASVNAVAEHARDVVREKARATGVSVNLDLQPKIQSVMMNGTEMEQVLVNLIHNALEALGTSGEDGSSWPDPTVVVRTRQIDGRIRIAVTDNGCGMDDSTVTHAFDPFYTTRSRRGGTGLGLSTCHGIVTSLGGTITIESEPGMGTTMIVEIPITQESGGDTRVEASDRR